MATQEERLRTRTGGVPVVDATGQVKRRPVWAARTQDGRLIGDYRTRAEAERAESDHAQRLDRIAREHLSGWVGCTCPQCWP